MGVVEVVDALGEVEKRTPYYRRYLVAMLLGPLPDVVLDIEPVLNAQARHDLGEDAHHRGELTAAHRLISRLHETYGTFIDALVFDALCANGPVMIKLDECGYGGFIVRKISRRTALEMVRSPWHLESTGLGQWVKYCNLGRVYRWQCCDGAPDCNTPVNCSG